MSQELGEALMGADLSIITDIYSAGEKNIPGVSGKLVYESAKKPDNNFLYILNFDDIENYLLSHARQGDLIITMGAGDVWKIGVGLVDKLS